MRHSIDCGEYYLRNRKNTLNASSVNENNETN